jgi:hypothetical protein
MVTYRARITILTLPGIEDYVLAAVLAVAEVLGAIIVIVAQGKIGALQVAGLIHFTVTIVVDSVAALGPGKRGVARRQARLLANPLTAARPKFVFPLAGRGQTQGDGLRGAGTLTCISNALHEDGTALGLGFHT